jgi:hypothetical protein
VIDTSSSKSDERGNSKNEQLARLSDVDHEAVQIVDVRNLWGHGDAEFTLKTAKEMMFRPAIIDFVAECRELYLELRRVF